MYFGYPEDGGTLMAHTIEHHYLQFQFVQIMPQMTNSLEHAPPAQLHG
jgi:hypothetical protein